MATIHKLRCNGITLFGVQCKRHHWTDRMEFKCYQHVNTRRCLEPNREVETLKTGIQQRDSELARDQAIKCKLVDDLKISECIADQLKQQLVNSANLLDSEINRRQTSESLVEVLQASIAKHDETVRSMQTQFDEKMNQSKHFITKLIEQNKKLEQEITQLKMASLKEKVAKMQ